MARIGLVIVKRFTYRGDANEEWSNEYWLEGGSVPADAAAWRTLFDSVVVEEKTLYDNATSVIGGYGYDSTTSGAHAVWSVDLRVSPNSPVSGTLSNVAGEPVSGDVAAWTRWKTSRTNSKGKPIYLRKYFHGCRGDSGTADQTLGVWRTAAAAFVTKFTDGTHFGNRTIASQGHDETIISSGYSNYLTTRTLKRRGKRPT